VKHLIVVAVLSACSPAAPSVSAVRPDSKSKSGDEVRMRSTRTTPLKIQLAQESSGGVSEPLLQPHGDAWVLVDVRGTEVVWLDAGGAVTRRVSIEALGDEDPIIGRIDDDTLVVLEKAPHAGTFHVVELDSGKVTKVQAPRCAAAT
jgi:hypothetical protein